MKFGWSEATGWVYWSERLECYVKPEANLPLLEAIKAAELLLRVKELLGGRDVSLQER